MAKVTAPIAIWSVMASNPQDALFPLSQTALGTLSGKITYSGGIISFNDISDFTLITLASAKALLARGFSVIDYPAYTAVDDPSVSVPEGIPGRTYLDEEGDEVVKTWEEWSPTPPQLLTSSKYGIPLANGSKYYDGSTWADFEAAGLTLYDQPTYKGLLPQGDV